MNTLPFLQIATQPNAPSKEATLHFVIYYFMCLDIPSILSYDTQVKLILSFVYIYFFLDKQNDDNYEELRFELSHKIQSNDFNIFIN